MIAPSVTNLYDLQLQQIRLLISKYDSMLNYIKQYNLIASVCIREPRGKQSKSNNTRSMLISLIIAFDKCVQQYCFYYMNMRMKHPIYFMVDPMALQESKPYQNSRYYKKLMPPLEKNQINFNQSNIQCRCFENEQFMIKQYFVEDEEDYLDVKYRMHIEIWKKNGIGEEINEVLTRYEEYFMFELLNKLYLQGFVTHFSEEHAIHLCYKKPKLSYYLAPHLKYLKNSTKRQGSPLLLEFIEYQCLKYLDFLTQVFQCKLACVVCSKTFMYSQAKNMVVAPYVKIELIEKSESREFKVVHESCLNKYLCGGTKIRRTIDNFQMDTRDKQPQPQQKQKIQPATANKNT